MVVHLATIRREGRMKIVEKSVCGQSGPLTNTLADVTCKECKNSTEFQMAKRLGGGDAH